MNYCIEDRINPILSEFERKIREAADACVELCKGDAYHEGFSDALGLDVYALAVVACAKRLVDDRATLDDLRRTVKTFRNAADERTANHEPRITNHDHVVPE